MTKLDAVCGTMSALGSVAAMSNGHWLCCVALAGNALWCLYPWSHGL